MKHSSRTATTALARRGWWVVVPTLVILALALAGTTSAAPAPQPRALLSDLLFQAPEPPCQSCHPDEHSDWQDSTHAQATLDPVFQEELGKSHNQEACLACHTTGFDSGSGQFTSEGVTCEACHGAYKEGHPQAETMQLPMESDTCRMCHLTAFEQWEASQHASNSIDCYDCHRAHTQGLRIEPQEKLCAACHSDEQTNLAHSTHGITGVDCASCHMAPQMSKTSDADDNVQVSMSSHTFAVASDVCTRCHSDSVHSEAGAKVSVAALSAGASTAGDLASRRIAELEQQVNAEQKRAKDLQNIAVVGIGLAAGVGGIAGLLLGIGGTALVSRRKEQ